MKLDPLINRCVIFKLRSHNTTMDATMLRYDANGYWIRGGTLAEFLRESPVSEPSNDVRYLEFAKIEWFKAHDCEIPED
jgi:hypothetical protein